MKTSWILLPIFLGAGVLMISPLGVWGALPLDSFSPPHLLVLEHLERVFQGKDHIGSLYQLNYPEGAGVKVVGWPHLLLALLLKPFFGSVRALYLSVGLMLGLGGWSLQRAFVKLGAGEGAALGGGGAWLLHPLALSFVANGQFENCVGPGFGMALYGLAMGGWGGAFFVGAASLFVAFSSPYHCFPLAMMICFGLPLLRPRGWLGLGLVALLAVAPGAAYYASPGGGLPPMGPGPSSDHIPVSVSTLLQPVLLDENGRSWLGMAGIHAVSVEATWKSRVEGPRPPVPISRETTHATYLGRALLLSAAMGVLLALVLPGKRLQAVLWIGVAGGCMLLALGRGSVEVGGIHLVYPWTYALFSRTLFQMGMTYRFVSGVMLALCGGLVLLLDRLPLKGWAGMPLVGVILLEAGFGGAFKLPLDGIIPRLDTGYSALPSTGAVADLPGDRFSPTLAFPPTMALLHGHPTSWKPGDGVSLQVRANPLNLALKGQGTLDESTIREGVAALRRMRFSYLAVHIDVATKGAGEMLEGVLGPADAKGEWVWGWVLK